MICLHEHTLHKSLALDDFRKAFMERIPEGEVVLQEQDDTGEWRWFLHIFFPEEKRADFFRFLEEYAALHGCTVQQGFNMAQK